MSETTLNDKIRDLINDWPVCDKDELFETLEEYKELAQQEVTGAKGNRNLQIHNTTREIYEKQIDMIEEITDALDEEEDVTELLNKLNETLDSGEAIG